MNAGTCDVAIVHADGTREEFTHRAWRLRSARTALAAARSALADGQRIKALGWLKRAALHRREVEIHDAIERARAHRLGFI